MNRIFGGKARHSRENDQWGLIGKVSLWGKLIPKKNWGGRHIPLFCLCLLRFEDKQSSEACKKERRLTKFGQGKAEGNGQLIILGHLVNTIFPSDMTIYI